MDEMSTKFFPGSRRVHVELSYNTEETNADDDLIFLSLNDLGRGREVITALDREVATAFRDHLNLLLGNVEAPSAAADGMSELAHQMSVFYTDDLVDALNRHSAALEGFNK